MTAQWWLGHVDDLNALVGLVTFVGVVVTLWTIGDCSRDLRVARSSGGDRRHPDRVMLARLHLRNELLAGLAQTCLFGLAVVSFSLPPVLPAMGPAFEAHVGFADLLLLRVLLRLTASVALTVGAVLNLHARHQLTVHWPGSPSPEADA